MCFIGIKIENNADHLPLSICLKSNYRKLLNALNVTFFPHFKDPQLSTVAIFGVKSKEQSKNITYRTQELDLLLSISAFCHPPEV